MEKKVAQTGRGRKFGDIGAHVPLLSVPRDDWPQLFLWGTARTRLQEPSTFVREF
jgi:hypothetical protein